MKTLTPAAQAAKAIRVELRKAFPAVKFSVTSSNFSMGDAVRIEWTDGVTCEQVLHLARKYQYGSFDGMTDCYEYTNTRKDIPQAKYVQTSRNYSETAVQACFEECRTKYLGFESIADLDQVSEELFEHWDTWTARNFIYRKLVKRDMTVCQK